LARGAVLLEKRLTLDTKEVRGHHHAVALNPSEFAAWVREIRLAETALAEMPFGGSEHAWAERAKWGGIRR
jgi:sialic acid synthase SpsE